MAKNVILLIVTLSITVLMVDIFNSNDGHSNRATLDLVLTGAALMKLKYFLDTDLGRQLHLQVIVPFQPPSPR